MDENKIIVPLDDTPECVYVADLTNKLPVKAVFVFSKLFNSPGSLIQINQLMDYLHKKNKKSFFYYNNLEKAYTEILTSCNTKEFELHFGKFNEESLKLELKNSVLRSMACTLNSKVLNIKSRLTEILYGDGLFYNDTDQRLYESTKLNIFAHLRGILPKELYSAYVQQDLEKIREIPIPDVQFSELDENLKKLKDKNIVDNLLNNRYSEKDRQILLFLHDKEKKCLKKF